MDKRWQTDLHYLWHNYNQIRSITYYHTYPCHVLAMSLPCPCHVLAMSLPCPCHVLAMSLQFSPTHSAFHFLMTMPCECWSLDRHRWASLWTTAILCSLGRAITGCSRTRSAVPVAICPPISPKGPSSSSTPCKKFVPTELPSSATKTGQTGEKWEGERGREGGKVVSGFDMLPTSVHQIWMEFARHGISQGQVSNFRGTPAAH